MFTFVLKDKGTSNQGWWLKISSIDELCDYYALTLPTRNGNAFENYMYGKEWNSYHPSVKNDSHCPHRKEAALTDAVVRYGSERNLGIIQALNAFTTMVAEQQMNEIRESGAIYVNAIGGYHGYCAEDKEYAVVKREKLVYPEFEKKDIKIEKFPYGAHYYAYVGDVQVKDGDTLKWNTYEEARRQAEMYVEN